MDYKRLLKVLKCQRLVILEDDFTNAKAKKCHLMRDFSCMDLSDQRECIIEIERKSVKLAERLNGFALKINSMFDGIGNWNDEVIIDDVTTAFPLLGAIYDSAERSELEEKYESVEEDELETCKEILFRYGLGIAIPSSFEKIFVEYVNSESRRKQIRLYTDFTDTTKEMFLEDMRLATDDRAVVCIVDNYLSGTNRAEEIIECIKSLNQDNRTNIVGSVFSSKEKAEIIDENLCFVYTNKEKADRLPANIATSSYHYFLTKFKSEMQKQSEEAFEQAAKSKHIASYLSERARIEGVSDYQVIRDWIRLMYEERAGGSLLLKRLSVLSRVVRELDDESEDDDEDYMQLIERLNTYEAFDYNVNNYFNQTMPGDIFVTNDGSYYLLIGQDCDMMMAAKRERRNAVAELLPITLIPVDSECKLENDLKYIWINYFKSESGISQIRIDYRHRVYIADEIINMCSYNANGECAMTLAESDDYDELVPEYLVDYRENLVKFFSAIKELKLMSPEALNIMMDKHMYLMSVKDFEESGKKISFGLKRVCRIKQTYVFFVYKLFLEYRGRQPFEAINFSNMTIRQIEVRCGEICSGIEVYIKVGFSSKRIHKATWYIDARVVNRLLEEFGRQERLPNNKVIELKDKTGEIRLETGHLMKYAKQSSGKVLISFVAPT